MDLNYSQEESAFRDEVRGWLKQNLPQDLRDKIANYDELGRDDLLRWHKILAKKGWVAPAWPKEFGGTDWNVVQRYIFEEECGFAGTPPLIPFGLSMCGPVILRFGTPEQKKRFLPRHLQRRRVLVPGLFRTRLGFRPRLAEDEGGTPGRPLRRQRPEDLDHARALSRTGFSAWCAPTPACRSARRASRSCSST